MKEIKISIDDSVIDSVQRVIEPFGVDIEMVIKILLNRISKEKNLDFLLANVRMKEDTITFKEETVDVKKSISEPIEKNTVRDMRKALAISIFRGKSVTFNGNITFASKNRTANNYWANPSFEALEIEWFLILNDWINRVLYLFKVPSGAISQEELISRADNNNQIDLQILYNDTNFRDTRSNYIFKRFLIMSENY
jgi:antitoxin component of RelBE/YafQ-DinJ toxin-antitoxin module